MRIVVYGNSSLFQKTVYATMMLKSIYLSIYLHFLERKLYCSWTTAYAATWWACYCMLVEARSRSPRCTGSYMTHGTVATPSLSMIYSPRSGDEHRDQRNPHLSTFEQREWPLGVMRLNKLDPASNSVSQVPKVGQSIGFLLEVKREPSSDSRVRHW